MASLSLIFECQYNCSQKFGVFHRYFTYQTVIIRIFSLQKTIFPYFQGNTGIPAKKSLSIQWGHPPFVPQQFQLPFLSQVQPHQSMFIPISHSLNFSYQFTIFHGYVYIQMEQEQSQSVVFENQDEQRLFEILTSKIKFQSQFYTQSDLSVDLVLRLPIPTQPYISRSQDYDFDYFFANAPHSYQKAYTTVKEYIHYQVDSDPVSRNFLESMTKLMKSLMTLDQSKDITKTIKLGYEEQHFTINSFYGYFPQMDLFTLRYNMIMLILQNLCGFRVKTFVFDDEGQQAIYFLLSQSTDNILNLAARHQIIKELNMEEIDFTLNEPSDRRGRPIRYQPQLMAEKRDKMFSRILKTTFYSLTSELIEEEQISQSQLDRYRKYLDEYEEILQQVYSQEVEISTYERQYAFTYNRHKINQGCCQMIRQAKQRHLVFNKVIELNQKFGYPHYRYQDSFFEFRLPPKKKSFFDKFQYMMNYKPYVISPQGEMSLFNKMERIKLSNCCFERYFKMENLHSIGLEVFALNDNFEKYGGMTYEYSDYKVDKKIRGGLNGKKLVQSWHGFIPFLTDIRVVRDYMGQRFAYETIMISHLISFFSIVFPIGIIAQLLGQYYFMAPSGTFEYQFKLIYLIFIVSFLTVFSESWKRKEEHFFKYYVDKERSRPQKENYSGPFVRNMVNDEVNEHPQKMSLWNEFVRILVFLCLAVSLVFQGLIFYGLRTAIVKYYVIFPSVPFDYISLPHLLFYGIYFWINYFLYMFVFSKLLVKFTDFQNVPTKESYNSYLRAYNYIFTFGVELIGPLFLYVIQPFLGTSCYSSSCIYQFQYYVFSRFIVILAFVLLKIAYASYFYFHATVQQLKNMMDNSQVNERYISYESKYAEMLEHVQNEYNKKEIFFDMREEALCLYYYSIFSMMFPFCAAISFFILLLDYVTIRLMVLKMGRRPISNSGDVMRFSQVYASIIHCCIIVNIWSIIYVQKVVEYNYASVVQSLVSTISADNLLMLKLATIAVIIIAYQIMSNIIKEFYYVFVDDTIENRKVNIFNKFLLNAKKAELPILQKVKAKTDPVKTVFRTFAADDLRVLKKGKFKGSKSARQMQQLKEKWMERSMKTTNKRRQSQMNQLNLTMTAGASQHIIIDQIKQ